jgi:hypothetical protein
MSSQALIIHQPNTCPRASLAKTKGFHWRLVAVAWGRQNQFIKGRPGHAGVRLKSAGLGKPDEFWLDWRRNHARRDFEGRRCRLISSFAFVM